MVHPAWFARTIVCVPASTASTWASLYASTAGLYSEYLTLLAPLVSIHPAAMPRIRSPVALQNRVSSSTVAVAFTLKLSVLLDPGTKQFLLPFAVQLSDEVGVTHAL